jgi:hypothetical protein
MVLDKPFSYLEAIQNALHVLSHPRQFERQAIEGSMRESYCPDDNGTIDVRHAHPVNSSCAASQLVTSGTWGLTQLSQCCMVTKLST